MKQNHYIYKRGNKHYEMTNHLGNVLSVVTDNHLPVYVGGVLDHYVAQVVQAQDYYAFGAAMEGRSFSISAYRFGFNGKENDPESNGNYDFGARFLDVRLGRWLRMDPITHSFQSPYAAMEGNPISLIDPNGGKTIFVNGFWIRGVPLMPSRPGLDYWDESMIEFMQEFAEDVGNETMFVDGSGSNPGSYSSFRYQAGYEYAKKNIDKILSGMERDAKGKVVEAIHIVTHSHGSAFGAGMAQYLVAAGYQVKTVVHLSPSGVGSHTGLGKGFSTPEEPLTYQFELDNDPVVNFFNRKIEGVDRFGIAKTPHQTYWRDVIENHATSRYSNVVKNAMLDMQKWQCKSPLYYYRNLPRDKDNAAWVPDN
ncbi:MAG: RHS repeat domain-containing protein, partial [Pseudomonadota bacterium]